MGISEFEESYGEDEQHVRGAILTESIARLDPREPICVRPDTTLKEAVETMNRVRGGCVLVVDKDRLVGIFTERDVLRHVVGRMDLNEKVGRVMTRDPEVVHPKHGIAYALNKMVVGGYRHIPVVNDAGHPVGVISVRDIVRFIVSLFPSAVLNLPPEPELGISRSPDGA